MNAGMYHADRREVNDENSENDDITRKNLQHCTMSKNLYIECEKYSQKEATQRMTKLRIYLKIFREKELDLFFKNTSLMLSK